MVVLAMVGSSEWGQTQIWQGKMTLIGFNLNSERDKVGGGGGGKAAGGGQASPSLKFMDS